MSLLTRKQAAERLSLSPRTLAKWAMTNKNILVIRLGARTIRYTSEDVEEFLRRSTGGRLKEKTE
jgi:excisionase family DNA binding protein